MYLLNVTSLLTGNNSISLVKEAKFLDLLIPKTNTYLLQSSLHLRSPFQ